MLPRPVLAAVAVLAALALVPAAAPAAERSPHARPAVVGGQVIGPEAAPSFAFYGVCGGTLIAPDRVATAAHCLDELSTRGIPTVEVGPGRERRKVVRVAQHPEWVRVRRGDDPPEFAPAFDAAILQLSRPVTAPVAALAAPEQIVPGAAVTVVGRGVLRPRSRSTRVPALRAATQTLLDDGACGAYYGARPEREVRTAFAPPLMICTREEQQRGDRRAAACSGDSGGPITVPGPAGPLLAGIVSWGLRCGSREDPDVSTEVPAVADFLLNPAPLWWPSSKGRPGLTGTPRAGRTLRCTPPVFDAAPEETIARFAIVRRGRRRPRIVESRRGTYRVRAADRGGAVTCLFLATNAGGSDLTLAARPVTIARR